MNDPTVQRMAELAAAEPAPSVPVETKAPESMTDLAFRSIGEDMALAFADDQTATLAAAAVAPPVDEVPVAETSIVEDPVAEVAVVAEVEPASNPELDSMELALAAPPEASAEGQDEMAEEATADRDSRLASAVRLTREAVQAWAEVVQSVGSDATVTR